MTGFLSKDAKQYTYGHRKILRKIGSDSKVPAHGGGGPRYP